MDEAELAAITVSLDELLAELEASAVTEEELGAARFTEAELLAALDGAGSLVISGAPPPVTHNE